MNTHQNAVGKPTKRQTRQRRGTKKNPPIRAIKNGDTEHVESPMDNNGPFGGKRRTKKSNPDKSKRKSRSKNQRGGGAGCSSIGRTTYPDYFRYDVLYKQLLEEISGNKSQKVVANLILEYEALALSLEQSALDQASVLGHTKIVEMLLEKSAELAPGNGGWVLASSSHRGDKDIVEMLLNRGNIDVNATEHYFKDTALHRASVMGHKDIVEMLLNRGADVNAMNIRGETALHRASLMGHKDIVAMLLEKRVDVNAMNKQGKTALDLANDGKYTEIVELIEQRDKKNFYDLQRDVRDRDQDKNTATKTVFGLPSGTGPTDLITGFIGGKKNKPSKTKKTTK